MADGKTVWAGFTDAERRMLDQFANTDRTLPEIFFAIGATLEFARLLVKLSPSLDERDLAALVVIGAMLNRQAMAEAGAGALANLAFEKARKP